MSLYEQIKVRRDEYRVGKDGKALAKMQFLIAAIDYEKDRFNGEFTDVNTRAIITKVIKNLEEFKKMIKESDDKFAELAAEIEFFKQFLPPEITDDSMDYYVENAHNMGVINNEKKIRPFMIKTCVGIMDAIPNTSYDKNKLVSKIDRFLSCLPPKTTQP